MRGFFLFLFLVSLLNGFQSVKADELTWGESGKRLLAQAKNQPNYQEAASLAPRFFPTSDGKSFLLVWYKGDTPPQKWLVSLPGSQGYATQDFFVWSPALSGRDIGFVSLQWWLGQGDDMRDYYSPFDIYRELDKALGRLGVKPDMALLQGFSRGSANIYAVAALDRMRGHRYFSMFVANSGGVAPDYPPTRKINDGEFGFQPFAGTRWITSCGERDPHPERDGCPAMRRTAAWLQEKGAAITLQIEDPAKGHGALNTNPENAHKVLDLYLDGKF